MKRSLQIKAIIIIIVVSLLIVKAITERTTLMQGLLLGLTFFGIAIGTLIGLAMLGSYFEKAKPQGT
jgi:hypothetical protein